MVLKGQRSINYFDDKLDSEIVVSDSGENPESNRNECFVEALQHALDNKPVAKNLRI
jgi:hypothetical protein